MQSSQVRFFGDIASLVRDGVDPATVPGARYIALEHIGEGSLSLLGSGVASDSTSTKNRFRAGDILFGKLRPYFRKVVRPAFDGVCSTDIWVVRPKNEIDAGYLFYLMASDSFVEPVVRASEGTKMPRAKWEYASRLEFRVPAPAEQQAIAAVLGALDDKIELNLQLGETLNETAEAIFESVFSGICEEADAPSDSSATLDSLVTLTKGRSYKSAELGASDTALVTLKSFARFGGYRPDGLKAYTGSFKPEQVIEPGEIVVALTDVTQAADVIGNPAIVLPNAHYQTLVASLDTAIVRPKDEAPRSFLYFLMRTRAFKRYARAHTTGTTVLHLNPQHLLAFRVGGVSRDSMDRFDGVAAPMLDRIRSSAGESVTLASLRDALLPRLLSGELRVSDAEKVVEEVI